MMTKRQRGLVLLGIFATVAVGTGVCNRVASNRVEEQIDDKQVAVRAALTAFDPSRPMAYDPEHSLVRRYGLFSISGGNTQGIVFATGEVRWAWEYRCVVGQRLPTGEIETRVTKASCSDVDPRVAFRLQQ